MIFEKLRNVKLQTLWLPVVLSVILASGAAAQQYVGSPVTKPRLISVLRSKSLQTRDIVKIINESGVNFQINSSTETELIAAGARPQVIEAARANYRAPVNSGTKNTKPLNSGNNVSSGNSGAVTKANLLRILRGKTMSNGAIVDLIEKNGVNFETTSAVERELTAAGASPIVVAAVKDAYEQTGRAAVEPDVPVSNSNRYESLINEAIETYNRDVTGNLPPNSTGRLAAIQTLIKAAQMQPNNPIAFQQLGFMTLYGTLNGFSAAEMSFRKAIDLGGSSVFRVYHDHDGIFKDVCQGSLYVAKDGVRFESDDNKHTFDATDANIKQVKTNSGWKRAFQTRSGSFKIVLNDESDEDGKKFSFAPLTDNIEESKMVIRLIGKK